MLRAAFVPPAMRLRATAAAASCAPQGATSPREKVLVITGPTAIGKSATALALCKALSGEIISADSVQVYRGLDIGSNKASVTERAAVPHHLLDIADPGIDEHTAGDFFRAARRAIGEVLSRRRLPVVVGGTMMYVRWLMYGRPATPPAPDHAKAAVEAAVKGVRGDWDAGLALLARRDPKRASELSRNDWYRLARALEVVETTGVAMTDMPLRGGAPNTEAGTTSLDYDFRCVFLYGDRVQLNRRIDERCEYMILPRFPAGGGSSEVEETDVDGSVGSDQEPAKSVLLEVAGLLKTKGLRVASAAPSRAIGYRQTIAYLVDRALAAHERNVTAVAEGADRSSESITAFRNFVEDFQAATRGYAKQQISWFRKEKHFRWVKAGGDAVDGIQAMLDLSEDDYETFKDVTQDQQREIREHMIAEGKLMKTYIAEKTWLKNDSTAERIAVFMAERCASELAQALEKEELQRMQTIVAR